MSVEKQEEPATDLAGIDTARLMALAKEALYKGPLSEYECRVLEEFAKRERAERAARDASLAMDSELDKEVALDAERAIDHEADLAMEQEMDQEAERSLQRWLKWQREVGFNKTFARDYANHAANISC